MVFTVEPMVNEGSRKPKTLDDGWTVVTEDGKLFAQFEHAVAVTKTGFEVLTLRKNEALPRAWASDAKSLTCLSGL
ncbi:hypothetical protein NOG11_13950 [Parvularcula sp. BGMRC 0090]|uniref:Type I methionyl aminopeptidase n=1 Tax=Parvularcula maris TaxID=2965077 RepID=A0A9X2RK22_9PROT|nr:hypothetical protein [Parvularcula maris]MCQ8186481.1 hypothetical protein [Parvularcula maris]